MKDSETGNKQLQIICQHKSHLYLELDALSVVPCENTDCFSIDLSVFVLLFGSTQTQHDVNIRPADALTSDVKRAMKIREN